MQGCDGQLQNVTADEILKLNTCEWVCASPWKAEAVACCGFRVQVNMNKLVDVAKPFLVARP